MKISPIIQNFLPKTGMKSNFCYSLCGVNFTGKQSEDTFEHKPMTGKEFKKKFGYYMPDLYTGEKMLTSDQLKKMKNNNIFKGPIYIVSTRLEPYAKDYLSGTELKFDMEFKMKSSEALQFKPVGNITEIEMTSNCKTPSFVGTFLPTERSVDENGFFAKWIVSQINRGAPESTEFGVRMLQPVTQYQQTTRTAKYGILIILLVFLAGFIGEMIARSSGERNSYNIKAEL